MCYTLVSLVLFLVFLLCHFSFITAFMSHTDNIQASIASFACFVHFQNPNQKPVILRKRRQRIKIEVNWELFYHRSAGFIPPFCHLTGQKRCFQPTVLTWPPGFFRFQLDHTRSNLIWNLKTREELRDALEGEMRAFSVDRELGSANVISWNHQEFEVGAQWQ